MTQENSKQIVAVVQAELNPSAWLTWTLSNGWQYTDLIINDDYSIRIGVGPTGVVQVEGHPFNRQSGKINQDRETIRASIMAEINRPKNPF